MRFNDHSRLEGKHAFLSASSYSWVNYDEDKLEARFFNSMEAAHGTRLHNLAKELILLGQRLPRNNQTLCRYVNDAISFGMIPEQMLYYSDNAFGTADTILFRDSKLQIHDLKTGRTKVKFTQLEVYTAFFCLEYGVKPSEIEIILRIYQNDDVMIHTPEVDDIVFIMGKIILFDKLIEQYKQSF